MAVRSRPATPTCRRRIKALRSHATSTISCNFARMLKQRIPFPALQVNVTRWELHGFERGGQLPGNAAGPLAHSHEPFWKKKIEYYSSLPKQTWAEMAACIFPHLTMEDEIMELELGPKAYLWWSASPYDQPQNYEGRMWWDK